MSQAPKSQRRPRHTFSRGAGGLTAALGSVGVLFLVVVVLMLGAYGFRREVARQLLTGWLDQHGIESEVVFERFETDTLVARLRAGPAADPDLVVDRIEIDYGVGLPWNGAMTVTPTRIRVIRPRIKATWRDGRLSFGSLDPVIEDFTSRPPSDDQGGPLILIEAAQARIIAPAGELRAQAYARLERGRLIRLDAGVPAARLRDGERTLDLAGALVSARSRGERLSASVRARIQGARGPYMNVGPSRVGLTLETPYPDTRLQRADGPVTGQLNLDANRVAWGEDAAETVEADLGFAGRANGWIETFALLGGLTGEARAGRLELGEARLSQAAVRLDGDEFRLSRRDGMTWRYQGDAVVQAASVGQGDLGGRTVTLRFDDLLAGGGDEGLEARGVARLNAGQLSQGDLVLIGVDGRFDVDATFRGASLVTLRGGIQASGGRWPVLGAVSPQDVPEQALLKRAFQAFAVSAPGLAIRTGSPGTQIQLTQPAVISPASGGRVVVAALPGQALFGARAGETGGGSLSLAAEGGGLPTIRATVPRFGVRDGVIAADLNGRAGLDFGLARGLNMTTQGRLTIADGRTTFQPSGCSPVTVGLLELGENDVSDVAATLCPSGEPMLVIAEGWRFQARVQGMMANAPFLGMAVSDGTGLVTARDPGNGLSMQTQITDGLVSDTETPNRFSPLRAAGSVQLAGDDWTGAFQARERVSGRRIADLGIQHSGRTERGGLTIDARGLTFSPEGLQPGDLSTLAGALTSPVEGVVDFTGHFGWTPDGVASGGRVSTEGLSFLSAAGAVTRLVGAVDLTSLTPLSSAPGQTLTVQRIEAVLPLTEARLEFQLTPDGVILGPSQVLAAGGVVRIEALSIPLDPEASFEGVLILDRVQLGDILASSGLGENVSLDAVVSGRLPFVAGPNGVTIIEGQIHAVQPGRLEIRRDALAGVSADGGGEQVPPNAVQDFAYQALENLSFDQLEAVVNTLPEGRMGVLFTIHGRHDPPVEQVLELTFMDIIRQRFMNQHLPLPSGTEVNLTLDTSFNLDELVADLMEIQRARTAGRSDTVQPVGR